MANSKFKPGQSGNAETQFKPGNRYRWPAGQSGNPSGIARSRLKFEEAFYTALIEHGAPLEAASLLWECARAGEPWAVQALLQRLAPEIQHVKFTHEEEHETRFDYSKLTDTEIDQLEVLLDRAATPDAPTTDRESPTQSETVCDAGLADTGAGDEVR